MGGRAWASQAAAIHAASVPVGVGWVQGTSGLGATYQLRRWGLFTLLLLSSQQFWQVPWDASPCLGGNPRGSGPRRRPFTPGGLADGGLSPCTKPLGSLATFLRLSSHRPGAGGLRSHSYSTSEHRQMQFKLVLFITTATPFE